ncbi:Ig-like domain-containing protein [Clostridium beijerinckii]|uniref:Ig-like domain-containing protein n=1 Tax=Clostridium beijerinckii TaxID=1520 RepID=UPI00098C1AD1|nr:Ig-like domain-containing protein [Clostridium beijerinckii]MBA8935889.1 uncharacterized protein YjdB [Clostridium beijerinckii]NRT32659.1 uncharacterized protein YjdB [Clostridium beijerinckii]NRT47913.1 uncharacterized protein YjdB [Clostridium beijerinckii]NRU35961.1 uncharacterized protein YjdB [Clostridium beijerinckii]NRZ23791.1 uncharacterized protein YjdB [Clostridium beijerinckii]
MKNYFKKFSILFFMLLAIVGVGAFQDVAMAKAATIGQQLTQPESGWKRYDDSDSKIAYFGRWDIDNTPNVGNYTNNAIKNTRDNTATLKFKFIGTGFRYLGYSRNDSFRSRDNEVYVDGIKQSKMLSFDIENGDVVPTLLYESIGLVNQIHEVEVKMIGATPEPKYANIDAIDVKDGIMILNNESISLDKSSMDLSVGDSQQLTATTTPAGVQVTWKSSDESVATVDENGNVTGVKEGQVTITAKTADSLTATCTVIVTKKDNSQPTNPTQPTTGDANLFIELVDGQIKQYNVSADEINKFTEWYENRDKDHSLPATYKFAKRTYKDYVVHDKIDWFEVR